MIHLKVQKFGDEVAVVLDAEAQKALGVSEGDTLSLEAVDGGVAAHAGDDAIVRGRLFVERYLRTFEDLAK